MCLHIWKLATDLSH